MKKKPSGKDLVITKDGKNVSTVDPESMEATTLEGERMLDPDIDIQNMTVSDFLSPQYNIEDDVIEEFMAKTIDDVPINMAVGTKADKPTAARGYYKILRQKKFLKAYEKIGPNISMICKIAGIKRNTLFQWKKDIDFLEALEAVEQSFIDRVEHTMFKVAWDEKNTTKNPVPGIFILKTKGQDRGYIERQDIHQRIDIGLNKEQIDAVHSAYTKAKDITPIRKISSPIKPLPLPGFEQDYSQEDED